jgi:V/A-type H+/Na+-transporting ATPase subunit C
MLGTGYAALYAKVKSWVPVLFKEDEIEDLVRMNMADYTAFVKERTKKISISSNTITGVEGSLKQEGFYYLQSGMRFLGGKAKAFVDLWARIYEIENLKVLTRSVIYHKPLGFLYDLGISSKIQTEMVKNIKNLDELQEFLSGTDYYRLAQDSFPRVKEMNDAFYFETNLDNYYAVSLKQRMRTLSSQDYKLIQNILLFYLETNRINWIYRARFHYSLSSEEVIATIPNVLGVLSTRRYTMLLEAENEEAFLKLLKEFHLIKNDITSGENLENEIQKVLTRRARKLLIGTPFSIGAFLSFIVLHLIQIRNMVILFESKRLELEQEQVLKKLVVR